MDKNYQITPVTTVKIVIIVQDLLRKQLVPDYDLSEFYNFLVESAGLEQPILRLGFSVVEIGSPLTEHHFFAETESKAQELLANAKQAGQDCKIVRAAKW